MRRVLRVGRHGRVQDVAGLPVGRGWEDLDTRVALIQALIPLGLGAVEEELQREVERLAGPRYARKDGAPDRVRWGRQRGSVYLLDHKVPVQVPRVRDQAAGGGGPSGELSEAATAAGSGRGDAAAGPVRAELPGLPGRRGGSTGGLWATPLQRVPPIPPGHRPEAGGPAGAEAGGVRLRGPGRAAGLAGVPRDQQRPEAPFREPRCFWTWNPGCDAYEGIGLSGSYELPCGEPQRRSLTGGQRTAPMGALPKSTKLGSAASSRLYCRGNACAVYEK